MEVVGIGCDIIEIERIRLSISRQPHFMEHILTPSELVLASRLHDQTQFVAGRFVAKEALSKALGCGIGSQFSWQSASILNDSAGKPYVEWDIDVKSLFGVTTTLISISHSKTIAMAYALLM
jgi:holo-[acyl-carrier protein] synthase